MAGIGFVLRKLMKKGDLTSVLTAYFHAVLASSGTWLFTVMALGSFFLVFNNWKPIEDVENFRAIILYNFSFSLEFSAPVVLLTTRYLADCLYARKLTEVPSLMLGSLIVLFAIGLPISSAFYFLYATIPLATAWMAVINYLIVSATWLLLVFISATQYYKTVTFSYLIGLVISVFAAVSFGTYYSITGMLLGFNIGLGVIVATLLGAIYAQYPQKYGHLFKFLRYINEYWEVGLIGVLYNLAIWVDKWIMWFSPHGVKLSSGLYIYPNYDMAMFLAYLTIVPGMAMFLLTQETTFFEVYVKFYRDIQEHASLSKIKANHRLMIDTFMLTGRNILLLQMCVCISVILLSPQIFSYFGINFIKLGIFRYGVLGATFQVPIIYLGVLLSYFDCRKGVVWIECIFFGTNALFTWVTLHLGFSFYGYGYFLSTVVTFIAAAIIAERYVSKLTYHAFITSNPSVRDH